MLVMTVARSPEISTSNSPSVPAQLVTNATTIASEIRVIIPGCRSRSSDWAPRRKTSPPYRKTIVPRTAGRYAEPTNVGSV
jgi:hypothetical protein